MSMKSIDTSHQDLVVQPWCGSHSISANLFTTALTLIALLWPAATARAQAPGVPIESGTAYSEDEKAIESVAALIKTGKLLNQAKVAALLKAPQPSQVVLPAPAEKPLSVREVYQRARGALVRIGWVDRLNKNAPWQLGLAGGYAIAPGGVVATAAHVLEPPPVKEAYLVAVTADGEVLPITSILAVSQALDTGIVRVEGFKGQPLALSESVSPGDAAYCFSDPAEVRGYFSTGIVNRFYWSEPEGAGKEGQKQHEKVDLHSLRGVERLRFNVTTDWAPGSSGAAVLDQAGNAIGTAAEISGMGFSADEAVTPETAAPSKSNSGETGQANSEAMSNAKVKAQEDVKKDSVEKPKEEELEELPSEAGTFQINTAIPARGVRLLVQAMGKSTAAAPLSVAKIEPDAPAVDAPAVKGDAPGLKIGDPAPKLQCGKFVQGEPVASIEQGKVYVVEFWATWCGPCKASIPHVSQLQTKYKDKEVIVIGQNCGEQQEEVAKFVKEMGDKMNYRVALDDLSQDEEGAMSQAWLQAAGEGGIPTAFVVDKQGKIAWIGHPLELDAVVGEVVAGTFDAKKHAELAAAKQMQEGQLETDLAAADILLKSGKPAQALRMIEKLATDTPEVASLKYRIFVAQGESQAAAQLGQQMLETAKDNEEFLESAASTICEGSPNPAGLELAEKLALRLKDITQGKESSPWELLSTIYLHQGKLDQALEAVSKLESLAADEDAKQGAEAYRVVILVKKKDPAAAPLTEKLLTAKQDNSEQLNTLAGLILSQQQLDMPSLELAGKLASRASQIAKDPVSKDSLRILELRVNLRKKDAAASGQLQDQLFADSRKDEEKLIMYVGALLEASNPTPEEMEAAKKLLTRVSEHSKGKNSIILAMLAQVHLADGNLDKAIEVQELAVKKTKDADLRKELREELKEFRKLRTRASQ